jgi:hypothetical protein
MNNKYKNLIILQKTLKYATNIIISWEKTFLIELHIF